VEELKAELQALIRWHGPQAVLDALMTVLEKEEQKELCPH
jgi:hypothetical protein